MAWSDRWRALGLVAGLIAGPGLAADEPATKAEKAAKQAEKARNVKPLNRAEAAEVFAAIREIADAVRLEDEAARGRRVEVKRPDRTVTPPSLTAAELDAVIARHLASEGVAPAPLADDATLLRRLTLDVTGRLPLPEELAAYAADRDPAKRAKAIDRLLGSDEYAKHWARYWTDVVRFRATFEQPRLVNFPTFEGWLGEQIKQNRPWDEVATAMISGVGRTDEAGQAAFAAAHLDGRRGVNPPELAGEVSRIFLGIQIQCAQCHDHRTDPWTREQFHQFAAFFAGTEGRRTAKAGEPDYGIEIISPNRVARYGMPDLDDPMQTITVEPRFFLADASTEPLSGLTVAERRELIASLVTGQDNPWFARAFVNRLWYELLGEAFYLPIDDLGPTREPIAGEVLEAVAGNWQAGGYDVKWLFRTILSTDAYARQARSSDSSEGKAAFASNCPSRLRADEIVAALQQALGLPQTPFEGGRQARMQMAAAGEEMTPEQKQAMRRARFGPAQAIANLFGVDPSTPDDEVLGTIPQALFLMNGPILNNAMSRRDGPLARILADEFDDAEALDAIYVQVLSRQPNDDERRLCLDAVKAAGNRRQGFEDVFWALLNSAEFLSRK